MSQDISLIRKELENHIEIKLPYDFPKKCHIKYITHMVYHLIVMSTFLSPATVMLILLL